MRTRINNITFTADTRSIDTGIANLTIEDIRLIVNETQKVVLCSSMQKSLVASIVNGVVTYVTSYTKVNPDGTTTTVVIPPLAQGDKITFEIDRGTTAEDLQDGIENIETFFGLTEATEYTALTAAECIAIKRADQVAVEGTGCIIPSYLPSGVTEAMVESAAEGLGLTYYEPTQQQNS